MRFILIMAVVVWACVTFLKPKGLPPGDPAKQEYAGIEDIDLTEVFVAEDYLVPGLPTVIVFAAHECPACVHARKSYFPRYISYRPDIAVKFLYMPWNDWRGGHSKRLYGIDAPAIPAFYVYGPDGTLLAHDAGGNNAGKALLDIALQSDMRN
jgi:hypothetical protein